MVFLELHSMFWSLVAFAVTVECMKLRVWLLPTCRGFTLFTLPLHKIVSHEVLSLTACLAYHERHSTTFYRRGGVRKEKPSFTGDNNVLAILKHTCNSRENGPVYEASGWAVPLCLEAYSSHGVSVLKLEPYLVEFHQNALVQ
uniref:Secreted protein n=1 Tax=Haemonchus placei TaxID=6290 RepID=A0A0N4WKT5_HAEPC